MFHRMAKHDKMSFVKSGLTLWWQRDRGEWSQKLDEWDKYLTKRHNLSVEMLSGYLRISIPL